jgi:hypothetical protein
VYAPVQAGNPALRQHLLGNLHCTAHPLRLPWKHHQPRLDDRQRVKRAASSPHPISAHRGPCRPCGGYTVAMQRSSRRAGYVRHHSGEEASAVDEELGLV